MKQILNKDFFNHLDYIWHDDEIPYAPNAKCQRSHSYYTNDPNANDSSLEKPDGLESLLDYSANDTCFFCVCSTSGMDASCIPRSTWFCEYFRFYRQPGITRDVYRVLFKQDRPSYFRQLSWRLRRAMDSAIYDFIDVLDNGRQYCKVLGLGLLRFFLCARFKQTL